MNLRIECYNSPDSRNSAQLRTRASNEGQTKVRKDFTIMEKAPTRAFAWLKVPTSTLRFHI